LKDSIAVRGHKASRKYNRVTSDILGRDYQSMPYVDKTFESKHKGRKSKEVLEQELFSLENQLGMIKTPKEKLNFARVYGNTLKEYESRFGEWDIGNWENWAKR
jgi:hypothetical protein